MKALESILVECPGCDRQATIDATMLEARLDRPLSINSVGHGEAPVSRLEPAAGAARGRGAVHDGAAVST